MELERLQTLNFEASAQQERIELRRAGSSRPQLSPSVSDRQQSLMYPTSMSPLSTHRHFSRFTTEKLLDFLNRLDHKVTIRISQHRPGEPYQEIGIGF